MTKKIRCENCGEVILEGECLVFKDCRGDSREDGIDGEYIEGAGRCQVCGKDLCSNCGDFEKGICKDCQDEAESAA